VPAGGGSLSQAQAAAEALVENGAAVATAVAEVSNWLVSFRVLPLLCTVRVLLCCVQSEAGV
jgi:hypothetical protein